MIVRRFLKHGGGASAVEFGLTAPVFFAALLGALELGVLFWTNLGLQHATERAARCASVNKTICGSEPRSRPTRRRRCSVSRCRCRRSRLRSPRAAFR